jgi:L-ascorbate metabolism protein UlaG (beta-lactamase superfamily)
VNWRIWLAFIVLSCGLAAAGCKTASQETEKVKTIEGKENQPTIQQTSLPEATATASPMQVSFGDIPEQLFSEDEQALELDLGNYINEREQFVEPLTWGFSGGGKLQVQIRDEVIAARIPEQTWSGSEVIQIEACDSAGNCAETAIEFSKAEQDFPPQIKGFGEQVVFRGEPFHQIDLDERVDDPDHAPSDLSWTARGSEGLEVEINERTLVAYPATESWSGPKIVELEVCDADGLCDQADVVYSVVDETDVTLTYIVNEGFIVEAGGKKILIDGLLSNVGSYQIPTMLQRKMVAGQPPFDELDLVLATHSHADHFDPQVVGDFLAANPGTHFLSTNQAVSTLASRVEDNETIQEQVIGVYPSRGSYEQFILNGIEVKVYNFPHGNYPNLGLMIDLGGVRVLHTGDFSMEEAQEAIDLMQGYGLPDAGIDIAFIVFPFLQYERYDEVITQGIQPGLIVPMHYVASQTVDLFDVLELKYPDSILFHEEMESISLTYPR